VRRLGVPRGLQRVVAGFVFGDRADKTTRERVCRSAMAACDRVVGALKRLPV
jgi:hypothetical protein